jgi:DNA-binding MarR family transcriptional regulator
VDAVAGILASVFKHLMTSTNRDFFLELESTGISVSQMKCLGLLSEADDPQPFGSLATELGLSLPAMSRAVDGLVQRGEVKRTEDPRDRRARLLTATSRGRRTFERLMEIRFAGVRSFVQTLTDEERAALAATLGPVMERLPR